MLVVLQFPLADIRAFSETYSRVQDTLAWPIPRSGTFVRSFGGITRRPLGGSIVGESRVCNCKRGIRFRRLPYFSRSFHCWTRCVFRRLFADGLAMAKVEVGFVVDSLDYRHGAKSVPNRLRELLQIPVAVAIPGSQPHDTTLINSGAPLANSYMRATSELSVDPPASPAVFSGSPLVFVEVDVDQVHEVANSLNLNPAFVETAPEAEIYHGYLNEENTTSKIVLQGNGRDLRTWEYPDRLVRDLRRNFRIPFLRCYAELQSLVQVLRWSGREAKPLSGASAGALELFLCRSIKRFTRATRSSAVAASRCRRAAQKWNRLEKKAADLDWVTLRKAHGEIAASVRNRDRREWVDVSPADVEMLACHSHDAAMAAEIRDAVNFLEQLITRKNSLRQLRRVHYVLDSQPRLELPSGATHSPSQKYDAFISHASEDKDGLVRPLAVALQQLGYNIWYDDFQLKVGDSLRKSIDRGLVNSRFGIVILSPAFLDRKWTEYELSGLVAKEMPAAKVVLPIWHNVTRDDVLQYSPALADRVALNSSMLSIDQLAKLLSDVLQDT